MRLILTNIVTFRLIIVTMAGSRALKQWCLTKHETINTFENWREKLLYTLSLDENFAQFITNDKWEIKGKASPNSGLLAILWVQPKQSCTKDYPAGSNAGTENAPYIFINSLSLWLLLTMTSSELVVYPIMAKPGPTKSCLLSK